MQLLLCAHPRISVHHLFCLPVLSYIFSIIYSVQYCSVLSYRLFLIHFYVLVLTCAYVPSCCKILYALLLIQYPLNTSAPHSTVFYSAYTAHTIHHCSSIHSIAPAAAHTHTWLTGATRPGGGRVGAEHTSTHRQVGESFKNWHTTIQLQLRGSHLCICGYRGGCCALRRAPSMSFPAGCG